MNETKFIAVWIAGLFIYLLVIARLTLYDLMAACISSFIATVLIGKVVIEKPMKIFSVKRWVNAIVYALYYLFIIEPKCHFNVLLMIIGLKKFRPGIVTIKYNYKTGYAIAAAADSITNTPGTVVIDIDPSRSMYFVHWLEAYTYDPEKAWRMILMRFDKWIKKIFEG